MNGSLPELALKIGWPALEALMAGEAVVVPREPTEDMRVAGAVVFVTGNFAEFSPRTCWTAMVGASPYRRGTP